VNLRIARWLYVAGLVSILLPPIRFGIIGLNEIARILWVFSGLISIFKVKRKIKKESLLWWFGVFMVGQSLSVLAAVNTVYFLKSYVDLIFGGMGFLLGYILIDDKKWLKTILKLLLGVAVINLSVQMLLIVFPGLFERVGVDLLHKGYYELVMINVRRLRIYIESYDELLIPLLFLLAIVNKNAGKKVVVGLLLMGILAFAFIANFRTRFSMAIFAVIYSLIFLVDLKKIKVVLVMIGIIGVMFLMIARLTQNSWGFNVINRLAMEDKREDVMSAEGRLWRWSEAWEMGKSSWFGVGMGNYYDNASYRLKKSFSIGEESRKTFEAASHDPHGVIFSMWAESGLVGLLGFLGMMGYFLVVDYQLMRARLRKYALSMVGGFWTLVMYSLANPSSTLKYWSLFWLLRLLIWRYSTLPTTKSE